MKNCKVHLDDLAKIEIGLLEGRIDLAIPLLPEGIQFCKYIEMCNKGCFEDKAKTCRVRKFYDKYPNYQEMFIGSKK
ncbi:hypothetical protein DRN69_07840 [Candidatus Pacearchaeota archaeon]|nr:MAG: hypothetical protein DRN69_07840 [Candidatus Pacearchaeota archaeon]